MANEDHINNGSGYGVPIPQPDRRFTLFDKDELYTTPLGPGSQVANPRDLIVDYANQSFWRVITTDYTNYTYELEPFNPVPTFNGDVVIGGCAPSSSDTFRVYVDDTKHPATLRVDGRLTVAGTDLDSVRIFRGKVISAGGEVISGNYANGNITSDRIPLALVDTTGNLSVKSVAPGVCTKTVENGELVTLVFYSDTTEVAAIAYCYIVKTNMVMAMDAPIKQVLDVKLISPFMSKTNERLLELPINIPLDDIPLQAEVVYTDGSKLITIDGTSATLDGLRNSGAHDTFYISSTLGQTLALNLSYRLGRTETYLGSDVVDGVIMKPYSATTLEIDGAYSVKLFVVPRWISPEIGYRLDYYLYDLERGNVFYATPYVTAGDNSEIFDPKLYNYKQRLIVRVNLAEVSQTYAAHIHPQSFNISLQAAGNVTADNFYIGYTPDGEVYGAGARALFEYSNAKYWTLNLASGMTSKAEWLTMMYGLTYPLYDRRSESGILEPTHFQVLIGDSTYTRSVDTWMDTFNVDFQVNESDLVLVRFIQRTPQDELHLAQASLLAHQK